MASEPKSLQEAILYFADPTNCREYLVARRWPDGVTCPRCGSKNVLFLEKYNRWHCREKHDAPQFIRVAQWHYNCKCWFPTSPFQPAPS